MRLLIIRHADPEYNGDTLTEVGRAQAAALARHLVDGMGYREHPVTKAYTSPMGRARDTAKYFEDASGLKADVEDWSKELSSWGRSTYGRKPGEGGYALWDTPGELIRGGVVAEPLTERTQWDVVPGMNQVRGQYEELCACADAFIARHGYVREGGRYRIVQPNRDVLALFCHGGFGLTLLSHLLSLPLAHAWASFWLPPSSVTTVLFDERSPDFAAPRLIGLGDASHLAVAGLVPVVESKYEKPRGDRPSGIKANFW
eukprot:jgi/Chlat1/7072/Chrsp57S00530